MTTAWDYENYENWPEISVEVSCRTANRVLVALRNLGAIVSVWIVA